MAKLAIQSVNFPKAVAITLPKGRQRVELTSDPRATAMYLTAEPQVLADVSARVLADCRPLKAYRWTCSAQYTEYHVLFIWSPAYQVQIAGPYVDEAGEPQQVKVVVASSEGDADHGQRMARRLARAIDREVEDRRQRDADVEIRAAAAAFFEKLDRPVPAAFASRI